MVSNFFIKSNAFRLFLWIYLIPFLIGCLFFRFNQILGVIIWSVLSVTGTLIWMAKVGLYLFQKSQIKVGLNKTVFKISVALLSFVPIFIVMQPFLSAEYEDVILNPPIFFVLIICSLYCHYFISKSLTIAEFNKSTGFLTYAGTFVFISMLPLGLFLLQPRIQNFTNSNIP